MLELILIVVLAILVVALSMSLAYHRRLSRKGVILDEAAIDDLIASVTSNISSGKIQDIASSVSGILKKHLRCDRIIFLKHYKSNLELNFFWGLHGIDRNNFRIKLKPSMQTGLSSFRGISSIAQLGKIFPETYIDKLKKQDLKYFFPVFLRDRLYGLYLIRTDLAPDSTPLNLLATTLAFNLSAAYHIGLQEQKIAMYEDKLKNLNDNLSQEKEPAARASSDTEMLKYLKIRKYQQLVPELLKMLKKDCNFSKFGFYVKSDSQDSPIMTVSWNIARDADRIIKDSYDTIISHMEMENVVELKNAAQADESLGGSLKNLENANLKYMMSLPWFDRKKAILAWSSDNKTEEVVSRIRRFKKEALLLVENISRFEKAEELSYTDGLTGMYNFRYFQKRINEELQRAKRYERDLALLILDIDDLKVVNDQFGHLAGDSLIKAFGKVLKESVRTDDIICRYGGDEFCLIMPETDRDNARQFMERFRNRIASSNSFIEWASKVLEYTVSIGGAVFPSDAKSTEELIHAADMALLKAKEEGRNCSKLYQPEYERKI